MSRIIPTENRATMAAYHHGRSPEEFLRDMWDRRHAEHPGPAKSTGRWPFVRLADQPTNVTPIRKARGK